MKNSQDNSSQDLQDQSASKAPQFQDGLFPNLGRKPWQPSLGGKFFLLGFLALFLCIPLFMVWGLVQERESNYRRVVEEIGRQWGADQTIMGPLIGVPVVTESLVTEDGNRVLRRENTELLIAPDTLSIHGNADTSRRTRGIHEAIVYQSGVTLNASFSKPDLSALSNRIVSADWSRARIVMGLSDLKGIAQIEVSQDGKALVEAEPSFGGMSNLQIANRAFVEGLHVPNNLTDAFSADDATISIVASLQFKGSQSLSFIPVGATTRAQLASTWPHPSFSGEFLPADRTISENGFTAEWTVSKLARPIPQTAFGGPNAIAQFIAAPFGVRFYQPVDFYRLVDRAAKYGLLFVGTAFLVIFAIEVISKGRMHVVHYTMAGLMVIIFYVLLLAFAEIVGFTMAFAIAAGSTGAVLAGFVASIFKGRRATLLAFSGFTGLYGMLYLVLRLEDVALLAGAIAGFVILSLMMFATRRLDWSGSSGSTQPQNA